MANELYPGMTVIIHGLPVIVIGVEPQGEPTLLKLKPLFGASASFEGEKVIMWDKQKWTVNTEERHLVFRRGES